MANRKRPIILRCPVDHPDDFRIFFFHKLCFQRAQLFLKLGDLLLCFFNILTDLIGCRQVQKTPYAATWLLHPDAPKIDPPKNVTDRIKAMREMEGRGYERG